MKWGREGGNETAKTLQQGDGIDASEDQTEMVK